MKSQGQLLIVDDEPQIVQFLEHLLQKHSYATDTALSAEEALTVLSQKEVDVLITDIRMPGMNGIDLIVEALKLQPELQCMVATGHGDIDTAVKAMELGAVNYFQKPLNIGEIRIAVENCVEKKRLKQEVRQQTEQILKINLQLQEANENLEQRVKDRTTELRRVNKDLSAEIDRRQKTEDALLVTQQSLFKILNSLDAIVYVANMVTYEVIFINDYAKDLFGDVVGQTCWQSFQKGQTGPCDFCSNPKLFTAKNELKGVHVWEFQNTINDRWFEMHDQAIQWIDGQIVRLEIAIDVSERKNAEKERERLIGELQDALAKVKLLSGFLPICASCKKIRDDEGYWNQIESYISKNSEAVFSHGICPDCAKKLYPEIFADLKLE